MDAAILQSKSCDKLGSLLTKHAFYQMNSRGLSPKAIAAAVNYGRVVHTRGAEIHAIGHKEVGLYERDGIDLSRFEGVQVVCSPDGSILTVYRNRDFRGLRPRRRSQRRYY